ncbi:MAG: M15 family metallopeptidase [Acidimicrobiia bacterium]
MVRRLLFVVVVACTVAGTVACRPVPTRAAPVNGRHPDYALTTITPQCRVVNKLAGPLRRMLDAAHRDGVALEPEQTSFLPAGAPQPPVIESCYRSYDGQVWWRNYYCSIDRCELAAQPGTSKHGLGHAVDFQDQQGEMAFGSPGFVWLTEHAAEYGFEHPESLKEGQPGAEAWHWEA